MSCCSYFQGLESKILYECELFISVKFFGYPSSAAGHIGSPQAAKEGNHAFSKARG